MPRIEIVPKDWDASSAKACGDGTPTIDVCHRCAPLFHEGDQINLAFMALAVESGMTLNHLPKGAMIGSTDVEHPVYTEDQYTCATCEHELGWDDH
jgi:hypothetical protein